MAPGLAPDYQDTEKLPAMTSPRTRPARTPEHSTDHASTAELPVNGTLAAVVYQRLRDDIVTGRLQPGAPLKLKALQARYGAGQSPIREALSRLASDTFVVGIDHRGYTVAETSRNDLAELTEARVLIECDALRQAISAGDEDWELAIVAAHYRLGKIDSCLKDQAAAVLDQWEAANQVFHDALAGACTSRWIQRFRQLLHDQSRRYRQISLLRSAPFRRIRDEHAALMEATLARDVDKACVLLAAHMRATADYLMSSLPADFP